MAMVDDPDILEVLRELQDSSPRDRRRMTYREWDQEQAIRKARGRQISGGGFGPGTTLMGHLNTNSRAPTGPNDRPFGNQMTGRRGYENDYSPPQFGVPTGVGTASQPSQYRFARPDQPTPWIDDVDMQSIWYSPFEPVWPFGPPYYNRPREWNFPVGYNLNYIPERMDLFGMLRGMRQSWGVLAAIEATRMDQLLRLPWTIQRKDKPRAENASVKQMREFFRRPDGKLSYAQWSRKLLFDLFDIDAPSIYIDRGPGGPVKHVEVLDGATIFPLIDDVGRRPDTTYEIDESGVTYLQRQPAFQQIIYGLPMINLSEDELIYAMMRPRPELPMFGYSPVEQIFTETTEAIRKTFYQLEFWRSGSMPELMVTVPDNWTPRQIAVFQAHFDALLSGQLTLKSKVRFIPGGMKPFDIKNASGESLWSQRDELLVRLACYAFSVSPTPFIRQMNRATAQNAQQTAQEEGLYPLMSWWKDDIMDRIIQELFGFDDVEFMFLPRPEVDLLKQAEIHQIQLNNGIRNRNEIRDELGQEPIKEGDIFTIKTSNGAMPLDMATSGEAAAMVPGAKPPGTEQPSRSSPVKTTPTGGSPQAGPARPTHASPLPQSIPKESPIHKGQRYDEITEQANQAVKPTKGQKDAGNYRKGHVWIAGLPLSIETPKGKERHGHEPDGTKWSSRMAGHYGYIKGTLGADGDQIDCCVGKHPKSALIFVIDQINPDSGQFDEHKVMLGYRKPSAALRDYYDSNGDGRGPERAKHMVEMSADSFKEWLRTGDHHKPISDQNVGTLVKADTISTSTNLLSYSQPVPVRRKRKSKKKSTPKMGPRWLQLLAVH